MATYSDKLIKAYKVKVMVEDDNGVPVQIGRAQSINVKVAQNIEAQNELGSDKSVEIIEGIQGVTGDINELMVNFDVVKNYAMRDANGDLPYMKFIAYIPIPAEGREQVLTVSGAKIDGFDFTGDVTKKALDNKLAFVAIDAQVV